MTDPAIAQARLADSAETLEASAGSQVDSADRRTELAADRTVLAAERTYAAWVRTGLAALASGIGARALLADVTADWVATVGAVTLVLFSAFCFVAAVWRELRPEIDNPRPHARKLPPAMLVVVNGVLVLVSAAALVGVLTVH